MGTAKPSPMILNAAPAAPVQSSADSMPPAARGDGPGPNRSFAATLAGHQPKSASDAATAPAAGSGGAPDSTSAPAASATTDAARKDAKAPAKPADKQKTASGGGASPVDGNALPLWLPPAAPASASAPAPAAAGPAPADRASADRPTAVVAADLGQVATRGADRASAQAARRGAIQEQDAAGAALLAAATEAEPAMPVVATSTVATPASPLPPSMAAALAQAAAPAAGAAVPAEGPGTATTDAAAQKVAAAAARVTTPADTVGAPAVAAAPAAAAEAAAKPAVTAALPPPVASALPTLSSKPVRAPTVGADAAHTAAPSADSASATPPVATDLKHAVAAVLSTDAKSDVGTTIASVKIAVDPASGVLPQTSAAVPDRVAAPTVAQVSTPVGAPDWAHELADRVNVLVNQNLTHAQIKLSPADLGPIEVRIALADGQASVSFTTHSHVTSEALQAAAPRLREALGSQGYSSVNVDVSQQQFRERTRQQTRYEPEAAFGVSASAAATLVPARAATVSSAALRLDAYA